MKNLLKVLFCLLGFLLLMFCNSATKSGEALSKADIEYIQGLGILDDKEPILLFDSQGGLDGIKVSGNFFTNKRIASYWVDKHDKSKTTINAAFYSDIDTIIAVPLTTSLTYASYLTVKLKSNNQFNVYNDGDSAEVLNFFNQAIDQWTKNKTTKH